MFGTGFSKNSSEILALWFTGMLDLADGSTEKTKRMQLSSGGGGRNAFILHGS